MNERLPSRDLDLTISLVTWNSREDIIGCLGSLGAGAGAIRWEAAVVDNASTDGTPEVVRQRFPGVEVIESPVNVGFGAGHNLAFRRGVGRFHLILNPDTIVLPGALERLVRFMEQHGAVGFAGPKMFEKDGTVYPSCRSFPSPGALLFRNKFLANLFPRNPYTREYLMGDRDHNRAMSVGWLSGAAIIASRGALDSVGLFDERFFMYCEDMDWCRRAHDAGWEVYYCPEAEIVHIRARSSDQRIPAMIVEHHRSMWKYFRKHYPEAPPLWTLGVGLALAVRASSVVGLYTVRKLWQGWRF